MKRVKVVAAVTTVAVFLLSAAGGPAAAGDAKRYVVVFQKTDLPINVDAIVTAAGGTITSRLPQIGAVGATSTNSNFAAAVAANTEVRAVSEDIELQMIPENIEMQLIPTLAPPQQAEPGPAEPAGPDPQPMPDNLGNQQWDKMRMNATATGSYAVQRGRPEVRVAVIDTGADVLPFRHPDIAPNLNFALSRSFVGATGGTAGDPEPNSWDDKTGHSS